jgi:hypothetical protein
MWERREEDNTSIIHAPQNPCQKDGISTSVRDSIGDKRIKTGWHG